MQAFMDSPLLSIVVPIRNMGGRLESVKDWLVQASRLNIEVIFVNDASNDATLVELNEIITKNKYRFVKSFDGNFGGPGPARNSGMNISSGRWIAFWDADDEPSVQNFFEMVQLAELECHDLAIGAWTSKKIIYGPDPLKSFEKIRKPKFFNILESPGIWRWAFKAEVARRSKFPELLMGEDLIFLANLNLSPRYTYNKVVYTYIQGSPGQLTSNVRALKDRKKMARYLNRQKPGNHFDLLSKMLRVKVRVTTFFWHWTRNV